MEDALDDLDDLDDFDDDLKWSWRYVSLCLLIPTFNGFINGYCWAGLSLHYREMSWSIARVGTASTCGFIGRIVGQKIQVRYGFWVMIPLGLIHLMLTILGVIFFDQEWAVICQVAALQSLDGAITNEGLAFDAFGLTEDLARQAAATVLAMFTISTALAVPVAGGLYDTGGWRAMSYAHLTCQVILFVLFALEPGIQQSFRDFVARCRPPPKRAALFDAVLPGEATGVQATDDENGEALKVEDVDETDETGNPDLPNQPEEQPDTFSRTVTPAQPDTFSRTVTPAQPDTFPRIVTPADGPNPVPRPMDLPNDVSTLAVPKNPRATAGKRGTVRHRATLSRVTVRTVRSSRSTQVSQMTRDTCFTVRTAVTRHTGHTGATGQTGQTALSRFSNLTNLKNAQNFQFHPAAIASLEARVAPKMGTIFEEEEEQERPKSIPWDLVCPALMISLCCFNNSVCYIMELGTFVLFFKEYHGWDSALEIGFAQCAVDLFAACVMKLLPNFSCSDESEGFCRIFKQPYTLSWLVLLWGVCNFWMASPWLVAAVVAQILMGSLFVYTAKFTIDLNLFYSLGDNGIFLSLQVWCKTANAVGACLSSFFGPLLYAEVSPVAPFIVAAGVSSLTLLVFTGYFGWRVGLEDMELAEERRARMLGIKRVDTWVLRSQRSSSQ